MQMPADTIVTDRARAANIFMSEGWRAGGLAKEGCLPRWQEAAGRVKITEQFAARDQVIRENPASRGTEASAEVLVGPPWRMESNAGQQQWY